MARTLVYQIYLFGFLERNISPLTAATEHLRYVKELGVDVVNIGPLFLSPWHDHGRDVADYYQIDSRFGTMEEFDIFIHVAHQLGIKVITDLSIDCTSTAHEWFDIYPEYYCWSDTTRLDWENMLGLNGTDWKWDEKRRQYYLHQMHWEEADLNWFPDGLEEEMNWELAKNYHQIIDYWTIGHDLDGFFINMPQLINKDPLAKKLELKDLLYGDQAIRVINALFSGNECKKLFLIQDIYDPTMGELINYYAENTPVDFVLNILLKNELKSTGYLDFCDLVDEQAKNPHFMLNLEDHNSPRFLSTGWITHMGMLDCMFGSGVNGIYIYQGQELGLSNPTESELPDHVLIDLDAVTAAHFRRGELLECIRPTSRANARLTLPLEEYEKQLKEPESNFNRTKECIQRWHRS